MTLAQSRTYWCHLDVVPPKRPRQGPPHAVSDPLLYGITAPYPEAAMIWIRAGVSDVAAGLVAAGQEEVLARLENLSRAEAAQSALLRRRPLHFELHTTTATWTWTIHPVLRLSILGGGPQAAHPAGLPPIVFWTQRP
ncbi:hypothetical protein ACIG3E_23285 [Streptomyces sp. NPDC053474]|uniref:hypothetical protein n=1 Tax=Streptomyces sp. NPDC053474 TaxID=3365704 RepID=UPI0037D8CA6E